MAVLEYVRCQKFRILVCVAELLQPEDLAALYREHPTVAHVFKEILVQATRNQTDDLNDSLRNRVLHSQSLLNAVHHALDLAKARHPPQFATLASPLFGAGR